MGTTNILDLNNRLSKVEKENVAQNNYNSLQNRPKINGNLLTGNKSAAQLGLISSEEMVPVTVTVSVNSTYQDGSDWTNTRVGAIRFLNAQNLKDIPTGTTEIAQLNEVDYPKSDIYQSVCAWNRAISLAIKISKNGKISIINLTGSVVSDVSFINEIITYTV